MERDERRRYHREFENKLHHNDYYYNEPYDYDNARYSRGSTEDRGSLSNYRNRYTDRGNYYGMNDQGAEYRNVRSTGDTNYGGGPVGGYGASSYRGTDYDQDNYRYGDQNPYMDNDRNGGYKRTRGTGWRSESDYGDRENRGSYSGYGYGDSDNDRYGRQDNSYRYSGQGRRYSDFGSDEGRRTYDSSQNRGYNIGTDDSYYDRSDYNYSSADNNLGGARFSDESDRGYNQGAYRDDYRYEGRIQSTDRDSDSDDNYATGLYASNRARVSDKYSERENRYSDQDRYHQSGPDYSQQSPIRDYGRGAYRG
ncbi:MAG: hypothetical protein LPK07_06910 [Hymenobacteraceae bacterium]|nr:hypothetical protein [Hymenobacteraceae bacterium]MDX5481396.1 hypothetical protein [Hymenobacteraceae bacterium]